MMILQSGFVTCIQEEKSAGNRDLMLDYLGKLMENASDFSWDSAKAAHTILFTNMEDRVTWSETKKIDRLHRAHAQRHISQNQSSATHTFAKKKSKTTGTRNGVESQFFEGGNCKYPSHHKTAGHL